MAISTSKLRLLYIMKALQECSDEEHVLSAEELKRILSGYGFTADRKTIYSDMETLEAFGLDIVTVKGGAKAGYYIGSRDFELPELKLLVDAVQVSRFITAKKSEELIRKIEKLASAAEAKQLQRNVYIFNRLKAGNETIYYNVDRVHSAILENRQIRFQYTEWNMEKELVLKKDGHAYQISPWTLMWSDENYYLIGYEAESGRIKHYRVDKMRNVEEVADSRQGKETFDGFDLSDFARKTFRMYGGKDEKVTLVCHTQLVGVILDRFGKDTILAPIDEAHFKVVVPVALSPQFFGWLTALGKGIVIEGPENIRQAYKAFLAEVMEMY